MTDENLMDFFRDCTPEQLREKFISMCVDKIKKIRADEEREIEKILLYGTGEPQELGILYATEPEPTPKPNWSKDGF